jgi:hypothetical protein
MAITSKNKSGLNYKMVNKKYFVSIILATILLSGILLIVYQDADAKSLKDIKKKMKKIGNKMEDFGDCSKYNSFMMKKAMEEGKMFYANPDCDEDEQEKYDLLNSDDISDQEKEKMLKEEAYGDYYDDKDDNDNNDDDDDDDNDIHSKSLKTVKNIGNALKELGR